MRIGFFTETYLPSTDGIAQSVEIFRQELEKLGHEVYVFAPKVDQPGFTEPSPRIIRLPAVKSMFDNRMTGAYFPPLAVRQVERLKFDIIHFHYPAPVGLLGAFVATKNNIPLVSTWHTDLYEYVSHYPSAFPGILMLSLVAPLTVNGGLRDFQKALSVMKPEANIDRWNQKMVSQMSTLIHNRCDLLIAPSEKMRRQLTSWGTKTRIAIVPTGIDAIPTTQAAIAATRQRLGLAPDQPVIAFAGRMGPEKNVELLIKAMAIVHKRLPNAKLLLLGDHKKRHLCEELVAELGLTDCTIFTGFINHADLGAYYGLSTVFAFPSVMDTQGLVLQEAAHAGLPIVMVDRDITQVMIPGENGLIAKNSPGDFANKLIRVLTEPALQQRMGQRSRELADTLGAGKQATKLLRLYEETIKRHHAKATTPHS